jgi:hypothetical protein
MALHGHGPTKVLVQCVECLSCRSRIIVCCASGTAFCSDGSASRILHPYHCRSPRVGLTIPDRGSMVAWEPRQHVSAWSHMLTRSVLRSLVNLKFRDFDVSKAVTGVVVSSNVDSGSAGWPNTSSPAPETYLKWCEILIALRNRWFGYYGFRCCVGFNVVSISVNASSSFCEQMPQPSWWRYA